jgi:peptidyl-prolyl cis-trans isomerase D
MLDALRRHAAGWIAKVFMGLLVVSFAVWGIADVFRGRGTQDLAQVGSTKIDIENFRQAYQERMRQIGREIGRGLTPEQARAINLDRQMLGEMISETALDEKTRELRLAVADDTLLGHIHSNPAFRGPSGKFDPARFYEVLRSNGWTEQRFVDAERRLIRRQQFVRALGGDAAAPEVLREAIRRFESEERSVEFVMLDRTQAGSIPDPSPSEIDKYYEDNKTAFRAPEYRKIVVLALTPEALASEVQVSDEDVRKLYEQRRGRIGIPERRQIEQIVFPSAAEAEAAAKRFAEGAKFEEIIAERKLTPADVSLGTIAKREILDTAVADAIFALQQGEVSKPITGRFGTVIARVLSIEPGKEPSFAELEADLRKDLATSQARNFIFDLHDKIEDERAAGSRLSEVANKLRMKSIQIEAVDRSGRAPDGKVVEGVPSLNEVVAGSFATQIGVETDPVEVGNGAGYVWYEVVGITPSRERSLEEVRDRVEGQWKNERVSKVLEEKAEGIRAKLDAGESFQTAAPGLKLEQREKIQRGREVEGLDRNPLALIFQTPKGKAGVTISSDGVSRAVYRVTDVSIPSGSAPSRRVNELSLAVQDDLLVQYVMQLQNQLGVRVNEAALRNITGQAGN